MKLFHKEPFRLAAAVILALLFLIGFVSDEMRLTSLNDRMISLQQENDQLMVDAQVARGEASHREQQASGLAIEVATLQAQLSEVHSARQWNTQTVFFQSEFDGSRQSYLLLTPDSLSSFKHPLVVYFHSMGNGPDEILRLQAGTETLVSYLIDRNAIIASPVYRGDSWLNPAATADVTQMIRSLKARFPITSVILAGVSMGGTAALMYPLLAPPNISVGGVVAATYASDVVELSAETKNTQVRDSLRTAYGGTPSEQVRLYEERSVTRNIVRLPTTMPIALYASYDDSMIPIAQQTRLRDLLAQRGNPMLFATVPGNHAVDDVSAGFAFVLNRLEKR
jgi:pimeloyl-ACP methyl ester carboxylesterase